MVMRIISGGVCAPRGFFASGVNCGIKNKKKDLALIYSKVPAIASGVFTANTFKAQALRVSKKHLKSAKAQAIIVNSGNANCFTGAYGLAYTQKMVEAAASGLSLSSNNVLVASTGIIGKTLPIQKIKKGMPKLIKSLARTGNRDAACAIMTTDKVIKEIAVRIKIGNTVVNIGAMAKGAGMVSPKMATMLCFITTDIKITPLALKQALKNAVSNSFNNITVDGCMSTNDTVFILANGLSNGPALTLKSRYYPEFMRALNFVAAKMAEAIVRDAEGATKFIEINVCGAASPAMAKEIGLSVANSNLFKTAAFGKNPNWGRIIAAVGSLGIRIKEEDIKIKFSSFKQKNIKIDIILNLGSGKSRIYTSDLSSEYVKINAEYT
ncbi:MAG TPA: bifunctional glutamate N-acetyltransferase/amino-acid acetyltransferase ArgJ [Candidatus Omnitrophica bacterium]|nr:bifunctional glutamate N-acetyltransferase/amino-acid acetyltransferase ArgJ [Candidatus Omnitrophota bacterium]